MISEYYIFTFINMYVFNISFFFVYTKRDDDNNTKYPILLDFLYINTVNNSGTGKNFGPHCMLLD